MLLEAVATWTLNCFAIHPEVNCVFCGRVLIMEECASGSTKQPSVSLLLNDLWIKMSYAIEVCSYIKLLFLGWISKWNSINLDNIDQVNGFCSYLEFQQLLCLILHQSSCTPFTLFSCQRLSLCLASCPVRVRCA